MLRNAQEGIDSSVCVRERKREREKKREREREKERERECVCVRACVCMGESECVCKSDFVSESVRCVRQSESACVRARVHTASMVTCAECDACS